MSTPESPKPDFPHPSPDEPLRDGEREQSGQDAPRGKPKRLNPTRYGDWEKNGRCIDF